MPFFFSLQILENIKDNLEEIEEEFLVLRDLSDHPNLPTFIGLFLKKGKQFEDDQLWFVMEVIKSLFLFLILLMFFLRVWLIAI